ncbi:MAG: T9SS type A sorting domain-containing protein [Chitinophagaceae bacterium]
MKLSVYFLFLTIIAFNNLSAQTISFSSNYNFNKDTSVNITLGGKHDGNTLQKSHMYYAGGLPDFKRIPVIEPLDSIVLWNNDTIGIEKLTIRSATNNIYTIDSLSKSALQGICETSEDSLAKIYEYVANHHYYYYVPEVESKEFKEVTRHFGIYGYGHCGSIGNCASLINQKLTSDTQRLWYIANGAHGISELKTNNRWAYIDADEEMIVKNAYNQYASFGEAYEDLYLIYRTKIFGDALKYNYVSSANYAISKYFNKTSHESATSYLISTDPCYTNDTVGNYGPDLYMDINPGQKIKWVGNDSAVSQHFLVNNICYGPYGYVPSNDDVKVGINNGYSSRNFLLTNEMLSKKFKSFSNITIQNGVLQKIDTSLNSFFILEEKMTFPILASTLDLAFSLSIGNTLQISYSTDESNWIPISVQTTSNTITVVLDSLIGALTKVAVYKYYIKIELLGTQQFFLNTIQLHSRFQFTKYLYPSIFLGSNDIHINSSTPNYNLQTSLYWSEYHDNNRPMAPSMPIYPALGDTIQDVNVRFHWQQIQNDIDGDSIIEWHFQLSEFPDFRHVLANNFDYFSLGLESNDPYFINYYDTLRTSNTFFHHNTTYYWRVRIRDQHQAWSTWSSPWSFTVQIPERPLNVHFKIVNNTIVKLVWDDNPAGKTPSSFMVLNGPTKQSLPFDTLSFPYEYTNLHEVNKPLNINFKNFRVIAMDSDSNKSMPSSVVTIPEKIFLQFGTSIDLNSTIELLQHPFPNYPSLERNYFVVFDTTFFDQLSSNIFVNKKTGYTLVSIVYLSPLGDTIYQKQIGYDFKKYLQIVKNCEHTALDVSFSAPINFPFSLFFKRGLDTLNKTILSVTDTVYIAKDESVHFLYVVKGIDTFFYETEVKNNLDSIHYTINSFNYDCSDHLTKTNLFVELKVPSKLFFSKDNVLDSINIVNGNNNLIFENGDYTWLSLKDSNQCSKSINQSFALNYDTLKVLNTQEYFDCATVQNIYALQVSGNYPITLNYTENGVSKTETLTSMNSLLSLDSGIHYISHINDQTGCQYTINETKQYDTDTLQFAMSTPVYDCDSNRTKFVFETHGNFPCTVFYSKNNIAQTLVLNTSQEIIFADNGIYQFDSIQDSKWCTMPINQSFALNYDTLKVLNTQEYFDCATVQNMYAMQVSGNYPITLNYTENGVSKTETLTSMNGLLSLDSGVHYISHMNDQTGCQYNISDTKIYDTDTLSYKLNVAQYICDSDYTKISLTLHGTFPIQLYYTHNSNQIVQVCTASATDVIVQNGFVSLDSIIDANGCVLYMTDTFTFSNNPIQFSFADTYFDCSTLLYNVSFAMDGNSPWNLQVYNISKNQTDTFKIFTAKDTLTFQNGDYYFLSLSDTTKCIYNIQDTIKIHEEEIGFSIGDLETDCINYTYQAPIVLHGKSPWHMSYWKDSLAADAYFTEYNEALQLHSGHYVWGQLEDANGCTIIQTTEMHISPFYEAPLQLDFNQYEFHASYVPYLYHWVKDGKLITVSPNPILQLKGLGAYYYYIIDSAGCERKSNTISILDGEQVSIFPNPFTEKVNIVLNDSFESYWIIKLYDYSGKIILEKAISDNYNAQIDTKNISDGIYFIEVSYSNDTGTKKLNRKILKTK